LYSKEAEARWGTDPVAVYTESIESVLSGRGNDDEKLADHYPLYFMTPNTKDRIHSQFNNLETIRALSPKPTLLIGPDDAQHRGITDGAMVRVYNDRGHIDVEAQFDLGIKAGCVAMTNGWWISDGGTVNFCSLGRETDMGHGAAFHDNLVEVKPLP
jgi:anaerobic selenocysteine-containing dehydrogenase